MSFQTIAGQAQAKHMLQSGLRAGRVSHAYIFSGPKGTGKNRTALAFVQALVCTEASDDACDTCLECRKVSHGNHPDIYQIEPQGTSIKIEQIRELQKQFSYRSASGARKMYIVRDAERMTTQAQNGLLKFLEEPSSDVTAILITVNGNALLPTIRSRAEWVSFYPMNPQDMTDALIAEGYPTHLVRSAVRLASGLDGARQFIQTNTFAEMRNVVIQLAKEFMNRLPQALVTIQQQVVKADLIEHLDTMLSLFIIWFKDMIYIHCGHDDQVVYTDQLDWMRKNASQRDAAYWIYCMETAMEAQKRLRYHVNPQLELERFFIELERGQRIV